MGSLRRAVDEGRTTASHGVTPLRDNAGHGQRVFGHRRRRSPEGADIGVGVRPSSSPPTFRSGSPWCRLPPQVTAARPLTTSAH